MATIRVMLNMDRKSVSGFYPLVIRVTHQRCKKLVYSPYRMRECNFDIHKERAVPSVSGSLTSKEVAEINRYIEEQKSQLGRVIGWLERHAGNGFSVNDILLKYGRNVVERYLFRYMESEIENKVKVNNFGMANLLRTTRESIKRFTNGKDVAFNSITYKFICDYINHLQQRGLEWNSINMYLRNFRLIYNKAKKEGVAKQKVSPFSDIRMGVTETVKRSLTKDMIRCIAYADLSANKALELARDVFLFSFYTRGMSLVDMLNLKYADIKNGIIYYTRNKTKQKLQVTVSPPLQKLIDKYASKSIYVLPYLHSSTPEMMYRQYKSTVWIINRHLKQLGRLLDIEIPLTTYVARHSWATIAKSEGASIAVISEGLGHTTEKTTRIYLRAFDKSIIDEVNDKVVTL